MVYLHWLQAKQIYLADLIHCPWDPIFCEKVHIIEVKSTNLLQEAIQHLLVLKRETVLGESHQEFGFAVGFEGQ